jgi:DNA Polymerase alpha zinc finger
MLRESIEVRSLTFYLFFVFFSFLKQEANPIIADRILASVEHNRERFGTLFGVVERYLEKCGRQWVAMDSLFAFASAQR